MIVVVCVALCIAVGCTCDTCKCVWHWSLGFFLFQAEDGIRDLVRSRGLGDVYKRQGLYRFALKHLRDPDQAKDAVQESFARLWAKVDQVCLLYTSDAADERSSVDLGGRRIIKKKTRQVYVWGRMTDNNTQRETIAEANQ